MDSQAAQAQYESLMVSYCVVLKMAVNIRHFHISHNAPYLPRKFLHNLNFSFLLRITVVPREIETMLMQILGGQRRCIMENVEMAIKGFVWEFTKRFKKMNARCDFQ